MPTETVLDTTIQEGDIDHLLAHDVLHLFHNNWIFSDGTRTYMPTDFIKAPATEVVYRASGGDDSAGILAAVALLPTRGGKLKLPDPDYNILNVDIKDKIVHVEGYGGTGQDYSSGDLNRSSTRLHVTGNGYGLRFTQTLPKSSIVGQHSSIKNVAFLGTGAGSSQTGLVIDNRGTHVEDVMSAGMGGPGIVLGDCISSTFKNVWAHRNGLATTGASAGAGWVMDPTLGTGAACAVTNCTLINCVASGNRGDGFYLRGTVWGMKWVGGDTESNGLGPAGGWGIYCITSTASDAPRFNKWGDGFWDESNRRQDSCNTTNTSAVVVDGAAVSTDVGKTVEGAGIPLGAKVVSVVVSTSFTMDVPATATATGVLLYLKGSARFADNGCSDNDIEYSRYTSGEPSDAGFRNTWKGVNLDNVGNAQRRTSMFTVLRSPKGLSSSDSQHLALRNYADDNDGVFRASTYVSTIGLTVPPGEVLPNIAVGTSDAYNAPNNRGLSGRNAANSANIQMIALGSDNHVQIAPAAGITDIFGPLRHQGTQLGFYSAATIVKPTVTGSRAGNAALASALTELANLGLLTNSSTA